MSAKPAPLPEVKDPLVAWLRVDDQYLPISEQDAWDMAWSLIGMCVERKQARRETQAA